MKPILTELAHLPSARQIAAELNRRGIKSATGGQWSSKTVGRQIVSASVADERPSLACCTVSESRPASAIFDRSQRVVRASLRSSTQRFAARLVASQLNATTPGSKVRGQALPTLGPKLRLRFVARPSSYSPVILPVVRACATFGATAEEIANYLNIPWGSFKRWVYAEPELREALKRGRDASDERVVESLTQALDGC
jgi:hypothetical protein